ncbi:HAUS6 protein, partial [Steatornis caripensis]|nr:HAUS6 protein [Steatornis caripensis]
CLACAYRMKQSDQNKSDKTERIQKVRRMWTLVMETLRSLKKEKEVVDSVLHGLRDQCILDGTNVVFSVPGLLVHRVESDIDQLCPRNLYEREKLNFVTVIQLLNEALRTLRDEHCQSELKQYLPIIELKVTRQKKLLWDLQSKRLEIEQQHCVSVSKSIPRKQEDWEVKWERCIGLHPFNLILRQSTVSTVQFI